MPLVRVIRLKAFYIKLSRKILYHAKPLPAAAAPRSKARKGGCFASGLNASEEKRAERRV